MIENSIRFVGEGGLNFSLQSKENTAYISADIIDTFPSIPSLLRPLELTGVIRNQDGDVVVSGIKVGDGSFSLSFNGVNYPLQAEVTPLDIYEQPTANMRSRALTSQVDASTTQSTTCSECSYPCTSCLLFFPVRCYACVNCLESCNSSFSVVIPEAIISQGGVADLNYVSSVGSVTIGSYRAKVVIPLPTQIQ